MGEERYHRARSGGQTAGTLRQWRGRPMLLLVMPLITCLALSVAHSQTTNAYEDRVMAVFVYEFTHYLQWPGEATDGPFEILVLGDSGIVEPLLEIAERQTVDGRRIRVRAVSSLDEVDDCQILFISDAAGLEIEVLARALGDRPILTIGEQEGFAERGVAINFILCDGRVCFEINRRALDRVGIRASSRLLSLARLVGEDDWSGDE